MIDLACPKCGRAGSIPRCEKINTRLVCKKCRGIFHVNAAGRTLMGEPSGIEPPKAKADSHHHDGPHLPSFEGIGDLKGALPVVPLKPLLAGLAGVGVLVVLYMFMTRAPESLVATATSTAERFAADDLAYLKGMATSDTIDDVVRWFDAVHPGLVKSREQWKTSGTRVQVMVVDEDARQRRGEAHAYIYPSQETTHGTSIAEAANAVDASGGAPTQPIDLRLVWILDGTGHWRLDGRQTFMSIEKAM